MFLIIFGSALNIFLSIHFPYVHYVLEEESPVVMEVCRP